MPQPLSGVIVLDFSTLLPGPMATLILAQAGARVIRIERPGGEDMRRFGPFRDGRSAPFDSLNAGKETITLDLKSPEAGERIERLVGDADVLVEQFRPGVMERLGFGFGRLAEVNPRLIYCSISGFGQEGTRAQLAGHDINYQALAGVLGQQVMQGGDPPLPPPLVADIAGGAYPAVLNILLALREREATGLGRHLDIAMTDGASAFTWLGLAHLRGGWPASTGGTTLLNGGSPRYRLYRTADGWFLAVGALEEKFWTGFCDAIGLAPELRRAETPVDRTVAAVAAIIGARDAAHWRARLEPLDCCCTVVRTLDEAASDPDFRRRALAWEGEGLTPLPLDPAFRRQPQA